MTEQTPLKKAISIAQGQKALAKKIGVTQQCISLWITKNAAVPAEHAIKIETETGVSRAELRPDLFGATHG